MRAFAVYLVATVPVAWTQHTDPIPVVGVQGRLSNSVERPTRQNINELFAYGGEMWDLYIQALSEFQEMDESDELSYFQISGIHGIPILAWNGAEQVPGGINGGYCPHSETLFATWHRPYVALFEQRLVSHAHDIAQRYKKEDRPRYVAAAQILRQPYWDWAANHGLPLATVMQNVTITGPAGPLTVRNPLYSYRFQKHENATGFAGQLSNYSETVRCPLPGGTDYDPEIANSNLDLPYLALASQTYDVFTRSPSFESMASMGSAGPSFEMPHNSIHNYAGCENGTLADVGWSAFDPLFMLHHSNVDRLIAMWQAIYYNDSTMSTTSQSHGFFGSPPGNVTADSPLKPFFDANLNYHTSKTVSQIRTFGYTYPEINDWSKTPEQLRAYVINRVNTLYGQDTETAPKQSAGGRRRVAAAPSISYTAEIRLERSEVPLPCSIDVRLGDHTLGTMTLLGMPMNGMAYSSVPLRDALSKLNLKNMPDDALVPYLQKNLRVEVRKDGNVLAPDHAPSLQIELQGQDFVPRAGDYQLPKYGTARMWPISKRI